jgi:hypothetical protein
MHSVSAGMMPVMSDVAGIDRYATGKDATKRS